MITAVIITKNEAANIGHCLQSLQGVADEVIVVDNGSTDETIAIAKNLGTKVIEQEWLGYGPTKNVGNEAARFDYILSLDADEALSKDLAEQITIAKSKLDRPAYQIDMIHQYCGKWIKYGGFYPDKKLRLFNRHKVRWSDDAVHEKLIFESPSDSEKIGHIEGDLLHYSYPDLSNHLQKIDHYSTLAAERLSVKKNLFLKSRINAWWRFIYTFFLRLGFLDGWQGFMICKLKAFEVFLKYSKALRIKKDSKISK